MKNMNVMKFWNQPRFSNADVVEATGLTAATVQTWVNRGLFVPISGQNPGYGAQREYSTGNVVWLRLMGAMRDAGFGTSFSASAVHAMGLPIQYIAAIARPSSTSFWVVIAAAAPEGEPKATLPTTDLEQLRKDIQAAGPVAMVVDIGNLLRPVLGTLAAILDREDKRTE